MQATHPSYARVSRARIHASPLRSAHLLLQTAFVGILGIAGLDKFFRLFTDWSTFLAPSLVEALSFHPNYFMYAVGLLEIATALVVAFKPKLGGYLAAGWFFAIIVNLAVAGGYRDIALRDAGLALAAVAFARMSAGLPSKQREAGVLR